MEEARNDAGTRHDGHWREFTRISIEILLHLTAEPNGPKNTTPWNFRVRIKFPDKNSGKVSSSPQVHPEQLPRSHLVKRGKVRSSTYTSKAAETTASLSATYRPNSRKGA